MDARHVWKPREVIAALNALGFTENRARGKGDHIFFLRYCVCQGGKTITAKTIVDAGSKQIPFKTMAHILDAIALTDEQLRSAWQGKFSSTDYDRYLLTIPRARLLPFALRQR